MSFKNRMKLRTKLLLFGEEYTFTRIVRDAPPDTEEAPNLDKKLDDAYKTKTETTSTFIERAFIRPARAYNIHSNQYIDVKPGGIEMSGIINIELPSTTNVIVGDKVTTDKGIYDIVAIEDFDELYIFEGHRK